VRKRLLYLLGGVAIEDYARICAEHDELIAQTVELLDRLNTLSASAGAAPAAARVPFGSSSRSEAPMRAPGAVVLPISAGSTLHREPEPAPTR
jgi:hypothetical protein